MLTELIRRIGEASRPEQIRMHRERYGQYKVDKESNGESALNFEDWLKERGVDPKQLLLQK